MSFNEVQQWQKRQVNFSQNPFCSANSSPVPRSITFFSPSEWTRIQFSTTLICLFPSIVISRARPTFLIAPMFLISCPRRTFDYLLSVQWLWIGKRQVRGLANNTDSSEEMDRLRARAWFIVWPHETCFIFFQLIKDDSFFSFTLFQAGRRRSKRQQWQKKWN